MNKTNIRFHEVYAMEWDEIYLKVAGQLDLDHCRSWSHLIHPHHNIDLQFQTHDH